MANAEKPFNCLSPGCNMSFINDNLLTVHKKKHDMMLNLGNGSKSAGFVDQTPTPTRFIRNCEEVGLFQDLQNVNPFEETFRRAVESGNTGILTVPEVGITDDTLHTPHIFPHIADVLSSNNQIMSESSISITGKSTEDRTTIDTEVCTSVKLSVSNEQDSRRDKLTTEKSETLTENIIHEVTSTSIIPRTLREQISPKLSINGEEVQLLLKTSDGKLMQLSATPICGSTNIGTLQSQKHSTVVIKTEPSLQYCTKEDSKKLSTLSLAKMKLKQALTKNTISKNQTLDDNSEEIVLNHSKKQNRSKTVEEQVKMKAEEQIKKKDILERNRASSMRARAKRKAWIQHLERTVANVNETNVALQMEIKVLRAEVAKLKNLLLAHKDCPVTKAMQKGSGTILAPKVIWLNSDVVTNPTTPMGISMKRSASISSAEVPIMPKKKLSLVPSKNPIIFPKVDSTTNLSIPNATLIKTIPAIKIGGVSQLLTEKEETKQILFVQNPQRKIVKSSRQIIQINPNYEIEHSATKSTGT
ncbi:cyclic AMP-dependent transcription factor ATF-2 isoform X2 [Hylaeus anthracinus]|uniref:cyclic AMP-dependent transcription factor ATF-2 isoform X2 n=1 Tax=Hylaeus volcanicus TaxID=313075 RepID=UPI0023B7E959|nr:cyclic AMP-dependent transcription factor ATF-2 isoform X2 [Hylaeus volcanicus]XP_053995478.1 cyclic AMP-dependent transcription factor ATF-2 isoform X2 [Hylaeus anthracinus]